MNTMFSHRWYFHIVSGLTALYLFTAGNVALAQSTELSLGSITTRMHNVAGDVVLLSDRLLEVRSFVYDGEAPAVYFWADTNAVPSSGGFRLNDGSPFNGCGVTSLPEEADGSVTYRVEFPDGKSIFDIQGGSISLWCEAFSVSFGEVIVPTLTSSSVPDTSSGPALQCSANVEETPVASPTSGTTTGAPVALPTTAAAPVASPTVGATSDAPPTTVTAPVASPTSVTDPAPTTSDGTTFVFCHVLMTITLIFSLLRLVF
jgi:hypothetical protein